MKKHNNKVTIQNYTLDSFLLVKIPSQHLKQLKGGNESDADGIIILEDPVV